LSDVLHDEGFDVAAVANGHLPIASGEVATGGRAMMKKQHAPTESVRAVGNRERFLEATLWPPLHALLPGLPSSGRRCRAAAFTTLASPSTMRMLAIAKTVSRRASRRNRGPILVAAPASCQADPAYPRARRRRAPLAGGARRPHVLPMRGPGFADGAIGSRRKVEKEVRI
jgi:hypothetical protein